MVQHPRLSNSRLGDSAPDPVARLWTQLGRAAAGEAFGAYIVLGGMGLYFITILSGHEWLLGLPMTFVGAVALWGRADRSIARASARRRRLLWVVQAIAAASGLFIALAFAFGLLMVLFGDYLGPSGP